MATTKTVAKPTKTTAKSATTKAAAVKTPAVSTKAKTKTTTPAQEVFVVQEGVNYLSTDQVQHLLETLEKQKLALLANMNFTIQHMHDEATNFADENDRASQESDMTLELRNRSRELHLIERIEASIKRLQQLQQGQYDAYGYCEECGIEVGYQRLLARPTATLCIECKRVEEIREKQSNG